jgi:hypothetical protein
MTQLLKKDFRLTLDFSIVIDDDALEIDLDMDKETAEHYVWQKHLLLALMRKGEETMNF